MKNFLFSILPFSIIHTLKKKVSVNYLLFGNAKKNTGRYLLLDTESRFTLYGMEKELGEEVGKGFKACYQSYSAKREFLRKYILEVSDCIIEPDFGWGITTENDSLIFDSISNNSWVETYHPSYFRYKKNKKLALHFERIISINLIPGGDTNYWHFLHDLLGEVALAKKELTNGIPFLISKKLSEASYFKKALIQSSYLSECSWVVRENQYIKADIAYFIQVMPNSNEQFFEVKKLLQIQNADPHTAKRIFLTRNNKRIRFLSNSTEIEKIAIKYGFEIIDADNLNLQQQIKLFGETKFLIGIHGAGLTNVVYRSTVPLHLFELLPKDYLQPHYFWLSKGMGHSYSCLAGSESAYDTSFSIDVTIFESKLAAILSPVSPT